MRDDAVAGQTPQTARRAAEIVADSRSGQDSGSAPAARRLAEVVKATAEATDRERPARSHSPRSAGQLDTALV